MSQKTPSTGGRKGPAHSDASGSPHITPVKLSLSASGGRGGGQLTGLPRRVKDCAADLHNYSLTWKENTVKGFQLVTQMSNLLLSAQASAQTQSDLSDHDLVLSAIPLEMEPLCIKLRKIYENLEKVVNKFKVISDTFRGIEDLERHKADGQDMEPIFMTWTADMYSDAGAKIHSMYRRELELRKFVVENVAHAKTRDLSMLYSSAWTHQPYITDEGTLLLELILVETGHR